MKKVWIRYEKRIHGHPKETYFLFDKEDAENEETANYYFENQWPSKLVGGENAGFYHEWEIVDHPPIDWLESAYKRANNAVVDAIVYDEFLSKEILRVNGKDRT